MNKSYVINQDKFSKLLSLVNKAMIEKTGIFKHGWTTFLPEFDLPQELEYNPPIRRPKDSLNSARFIFSRVMFDKRCVSDDLHYYLKQVWENENKRWFFDPKKASQKSEKELEEIVKKDLHYGILADLTGPWVKYNAQLLSEKYNGDPRLLLENEVIENARTKIKEFKGFGDGLTDLFIAEMLRRLIAIPTDYDTFTPKIDIHKARLAINTNALELTPEYRMIHHGGLGKSVGQAYRNAANDSDIDLVPIEGGLWIIGSKVCAQKDYLKCQMYCPLEQICEANCSEHRSKKLNPKPELHHDNRGAGHILIYDEKGKRIDNRKNTGITDLFPEIHERPKRKYGIKGHTSGEESIGNKLNLYQGEFKF